MISGRLKKADLVRIMAGKDRGKSAKVEKILWRRGRVVVAGINLAKKHVRPTKKYLSGGIISQPLAISVSNVMVICPNCQKTARVGLRATGDQKFRLCKKCGQNLELEKGRL